MPLEFWIWLWKAVFWISIGLFATLAVVVTIGGAVDVAKLIRALKEAHADAQRSADD
jgi:hypothetical protein